MGFFLIKKREEEAVLQNSFDRVKRDIFKIFEWLNFLYHQNSEQDRIIFDLRKQLQYMPKSREELRELIDTYYALAPLQHKVEKLDAKMEHLELTHRSLASLKFNLEELKSKVESLENSSSAANSILRRIDDIKSKIEDLESSQAPLKKHLENHHTRLETLEKQPNAVLQQVQAQPQQVVSRESNLRERLLRKIVRTSKDHVKNIIRSLIMKYGKISALQLREMLVEEQGLCSKSSFYRILEEIETEEDISVIHDKKEKRYLYNAQNLSKDQ